MDKGNTENLAFESSCSFCAEGVPRMEHEILLAMIELSTGNSNKMQFSEKEVLQYIESERIFELSHKALHDRLYQSALMWRGNEDYVKAGNA